MKDFFEKYELLGVEKECESTKIYKAQNKVSGNIVCINLFKENCFEEFIKNLYDNLDSYKSIDDENILKIYDVGKCVIEEVNYDYIEKEYVQGKDLESIMNDLGKIEIDDSLEIAKSIIKGLNFFHKNNSCDGNLRPRNIIVGVDLEAKLDLVTYPKHEEGDLGYTSPEQAIVNYVTIYDDIYSLGVILFKMLTGRLPFGELDSREDVFKVVAGGLKFEEEDKLEDKLEDILRKSLQARPLDRYFDLEEYLSDIDSYLSSRSEDDRQIVVIEDGDVSTYYLDGESDDGLDEIENKAVEVDSSDINNSEEANDVNDGVIADNGEVYNVTDGIIADSIEVYDVTDGLIADSNEVYDVADEKITDTNSESGVIINEDVNVISEDGSIIDNADAVVSEENKNLNELHIPNNIYSDVEAKYKNNEIDIEDKIEDTECEDENIEHENEDTDDEYGNCECYEEHKEKKLKVLVGALSVAVCVVGVASFLAVKDIIAGENSYNNNDSGGNAVFNSDDNDDENYQDSNYNKEENINTDSENNNTEENNNNENAGSEGNNSEETPEVPENNESNNNGGSHNNSGNGNNGNNSNNNQNKPGESENNGNNDSQNKPGNGDQNNGNNNGGSDNNTGNNNGTNNDGSDNGNVDNGGADNPGADNGGSGDNSNQGNTGDSGSGNDGNAGNSTENPPAPPTPNPDPNQQPQSEQ